MKSIGIIRKLDGVGRFVMPKSMRHMLSIGDEDPLEVFIEGDRIILRKHIRGCSLCGYTDRSTVEIYPEKHICTACVRIIVRDAVRLERDATIKN